MNFKNVFIEAVCVLFIVLWIYAGLSKLLDYDTFKIQLGKSPYIDEMAGIIAIGLPIGEVALAFLLAFRATRQVGLYLSFFLMLLFTGYIYAIMHFSYYVPCSCGGILNNLGWTEHFYFNIGFTLLSAAAILISGINFKNEKANKSDLNSWAVK